MSEKEKPKAVVVGGSIAGVSCAHALISAGWDVVVLEKSCAPITGSPTGAGLGLDPLAQTLIQSWLQQPELLHNSTLPLTVDLVQPMAPKKKKKTLFCLKFCNNVHTKQLSKIKRLQKIQVQLVSENRKRRTLYYLMCLVVSRAVFNYSNSVDFYF
jgi:2-polyprenyl-6-methoxyphenol hydroxylase-like FAD-dependent oxidoreductase